MPTLEAIASVSAVVSALSDLYNLRRGPANFPAILAAKRKAFKPEQLTPEFVGHFNTYSDSELRKIERDLLNCRRLFREQGSGQQRIKCLCSVLREVKLGNNGFPNEEWQQLAEGLGCG